MVSSPRSGPQSLGGKSFTMVLAALAWLAAYSLIRPLADWLAYDLFSLDASSRLGESVAFFFYDVPKILLLLSGVIFLISIVRTFFSPAKTRALLGGRREGLGNVLAALLGVVTPFCSCSAVPLFIGFVEAGIPLGVTFSFLIAAPIINEVAVVLLLGTFGWQIAGLYISTGMVIAIFAGMVIGRLRPERHIEPFVWEIHRQEPVQQERLNWDQRIHSATQAMKEIVGRVWPFVVLAIAIGAALHGYVPEETLSGLMGREVWWAVPAAVLIGVPLYSNAAGMIPIVSVLIEKGAPLGTALAFMMAVVGLSVPELVILRRVLKPPLLAIFVATVALAIILTGYLFNWIM